MNSKKAEEIRQENAGKIICFAVGRHVPYKGYEYLIKASKYLDDRFRIFIGGTGPLTDDLKAQAAGDEKISFLGRVSDEDLIAYYQAMDIFCFPSITKNEAFGIALAEAMYFGKPAVTFTIPGSGVNYVCLNGEDGIEVPNRDVKAYADAMKQLASDESLRRRMGKAGKKRVKENFLDGQFRENIQHLVRDL
ncbi:MAG: glycosyltransferase [Flexilinea sp.]|nr:glycosyltransferase [Flexilinea sp.]